MKKKQFLTESDRKQILADKEKAILESFAKTFNSIKRIDENELKENVEVRDEVGTNLMLNNAAKKVYQYIKQNKYPVRLVTDKGQSIGDVNPNFIVTTKVDYLTNFDEKIDFSGLKQTITKIGIRDGGIYISAIGSNTPVVKDNLDNLQSALLSSFNFLEKSGEVQVSPGGGSFAVRIKPDMLKQGQVTENELDEALTKQITTGTGWDAQTKTVKQGNLELNSYAKQLYQLFKKDGANPTLFSGNKGINVQQSENNVVIVVVDNDLMITIQKVGDPMAMANKYGPMIQREFPKLKLTQKPTEIGAEGWGAGPGVEFTFSLENGGAEQQM